MSKTAASTCNSARPSAAPTSANLHQGDVWATLQNFKRRHQKQNNEIVRRNTLLATQMRRIENVNVELMTENFELRTSMLSLTHELQSRSNESNSRAKGTSMSSFEDTFHGTPKRCDACAHTVKDVEMLRTQILELKNVVSQLFAIIQCWQESFNDAFTRSKPLLASSAFDSVRTPQHTTLSTASHSRSPHESICVTQISPLDHLSLSRDMIDGLADSCAIQRTTPPLDILDELGSSTTKDYNIYGTETNGIGIQRSFHVCSEEVGASTSSRQWRKHREHNEQPAAKMHRTHAQQQLPSPHLQDQQQQQQQLFDAVITRSRREKSKLSYTEPKLNTYVPCPFRRVNKF